jgi:hypothetical protein
MKELQVAQSPEILWQDLEASNHWAVRFIHHKALNICCKILVQKLTTGYVEI